MAAGVAIGLSRFEQALDLHGRDSSASYPSAVRPAATMVPHDRYQHLHHYQPPPYLDSTAEHHRPPASRPRLPSISNFLEGVGRPDLAVRPPPIGSQPPPPPPPFPDRHNGILSPAASTGTPAGWPTDRPAVVSSRFDTAPPPHPLKTEIPPSYPGRDAYNHEFASPTVSQSPDARHRPPQDESSSRQAPLLETGPMGKTVVGEDVIPGKGMCFIYDDGTYCQKVINGDAVNPKWGTTKAGKPRKRLGQACNTCREKKIKCDPSFPKCLQCQKFGRDCVFEAPSRAAHRIPKVPELDRSRNISEILQDKAAANALVGDNGDATPASDTERPMVEFHGVPAEAPGPDDSRLAVGAAVNGSKRTKISPNPLDTGRRSPDGSAEATRDTYHHKPRADYGYTLERDPFEVNRELTEAILQAYFTSVNTATLCLLPQSLFSEWASREADKSAESRLVVYSMLAVGTLFYQSPEKDTLNQLFINIAFDKVMRTSGVLTVQLVQARLLFTLHEFQLGQFVKAWELCGSAMRAACTIGLNTEEGIKAAALQCPGFFGLDDGQLVECVRRTFWLAFVMDRVGVACFNFVSSFSKDDLFLYLPCTDAAYARGAIPPTRFLDGDPPDRDGPPREAASAPGEVSYLVEIISLIADVQMLAHRHKRQVHTTGADRCQRWRQELEHQLRRWETRYAATLSAASPRLPSDGSSAGGLHIMYHLATMQLHRYLPHKRLGSADVAHHITLAHQHACKALELAEQLVSRDHVRIKDYHIACNSPISGFAVMAAIDIVTAAGLNADLLAHDGRLMMLTMNSVGFFDHLAEFWLSAKRQRDHVAARVRSLLHSARRATAEGKTGFFVSNPIGMSLGADNDVVYGTDRLFYFEVMNWSAAVPDRSQLVEIPTELMGRVRG